MIRCVMGDLTLRTKRASGPLRRGRHKCLQWARNQGLLGQEPGKPAPAEPQPASPRASAVAPKPPAAPVRKAAGAFDDRK